MRNILVKVTITMEDGSSARHTGRYCSVADAMDIACYAFPEANSIWCINLGAAQ
ncbi:MAG: hypothetical protein Q7K57_12815 [Burkholderiaceae bacterium]|nr:hypothetical protein [Burkholderiaceae bacterium]